MQQKTNQINFRVKKVIKKKGDKLYIYIKRKGDVNSFNSWIDEKDFIEIELFSKTI